MQGKLAEKGSRRRESGGEGGMMGEETDMQKCRHAVSWSQAFDSNRRLGVKGFTPSVPRSQTFDSRKVLGVTPRERDK